MLTRTVRPIRNHHNVITTLPSYNTPSSSRMFALTRYRAKPGQEAPPKTFSRQHELPRLPIPPLQQTFPRYLASLEPILKQKEANGELPQGATAQSELEKRKEWVQDFIKPSGVGNLLQNRLIDVDRTSESNWLNDRYWLVAAYHSWRVPLLVNSNWWLMFTDDPNTPEHLLGHKGHGVADYLVDADPAKALGEQKWDEAEWGVRRATWIVSRYLEFKRRLDEEDMIPDASRAGPFCMNQYKLLYGITRIPALPHDWNTNPGHPVKSRHITVAVRDNFYHVDVFRAASSKGQPDEPVALDDLEKALWEIIEDAKKGDGEGVGVLSSHDRDTWTKTREHLLLIDPENRASAQSIEDSIMVLALDSSVLPNSASHPPVPHSATPESVDALARNTSGAGRGGLNRWFDKALTVSVEPNGRAGMMGEHSPCDALIPSIIADYANAVPCPPLGSALPNVAPYSSVSGPVSWRKLEWRLDDQARSDIADAREHARKVSADADIRLLYFDEYGADWIKKVGRHSPDAYLQMSLQLAYARMHGRQTATYETASTRLYKHGRTDVIRTFSNPAYDFVTAVVAGKSNPQELFSLLTAATSSHNQLTRDSSTGKGIDRHITGLRMVYDATRDGPAHPLLADDLLGESQTWKLSTSGLSAGDRFAGTGFGAGYADGYGINYLAGSKLLKFGIESKHSNESTSTTKFAKHVVEALRTMREICEKGAPPAEQAQKGGKL